MIYIYNIFTIAAILFCLLKKPDFLMVYLFSSILYMIPLNLGCLYNMRYDGRITVFNEIPISNSLYIFAILNLLTTVFWMYLKDESVRFKIYDGKQDKREDDLVIRRSAYILLVLLGISLLKNRAFLFNGSFDKVRFIQQVSILETIVRYWGIYLATWTFTRRKKDRISIMISIVYIAYSLLFGRRSDLVLITIMSFVYYLEKNNNENKTLIYYFKSHKILFTAIFLMGLLIMPLKRSLPSFISGDFYKGFIYTIRYLFDKKTYSISESNSITLYINQVFKARDIQLFRPYLIDLLSVIPFGNMLTNCWIQNNSFDIYFQKTYFPTITKDVFGLAGSFWAENYVNFGFIGMLVTINVLCLIICLIEKKTITRRNDIFTPLYLIVLVHISFYIHRLHLAHILNVIKYSVCILAIIGTIKIFTEKIEGKKTKINW